MGDDHLNLAIARDGTLFAAVKTSYDRAGYPKIGMLVRRPSGAWDPLHAVDEAGTRPIALLDEARGRILCVYTAKNGYRDIVCKVASIRDLRFGKRSILMKGRFNNVTSTKVSRFSKEVMILATSPDRAAGVLLRAPSGKLEK